MTILNGNQFGSNEKVVLISQSGQKLGLVDFKYAFDYAKNLKLQLALISNKDQIIVKPIDYGKMLYNQKKNLKKQKLNVTKLHQIKFKLNIADNDYKIKLNKIKQFIQNGDKVKVTLSLSGRQLTRIDFANQFMNNVIINLSSFCKTEDQIKLNGRTISLIFKKN